MSSEAASEPPQLGQSRLARPRLEVAADGRAGAASGVGVGVVGLVDLGEHPVVVAGVAERAAAFATDHLRSGQLRAARGTLPLERGHAVAAVLAAPTQERPHLFVGYERRAL